MSDRYVEKSFLYLIALSVLLHLAIYGLFSLIPPDKEKKSQEPTMVDLSDLPDLPPAPPAPKPSQKQQRLAEKPHRVTREMAPKGSEPVERLVPQMLRPSRPAPPSRAEARPETSATPGPGPQALRPPKATEAPVTRGEGLFKPKTPAAAARPNLFPSPERMARLEENYRKKYEAEVQEGDTKFLNTDDIQFGSFLRRFETAVYGVWHYPEAALMRGEQGVTPVKITFNRSGEIMKVVLLDSSGSRILDEEVLRTLKALGPVGSFPRGYTGKEFNLIAFFQYGGSGGGRLH